jgi:4-carboxymuconolactone decarboxylase
MARANSADVSSAMGNCFEACGGGGELSDKDDGEIIAAYQALMLKKGAENLLRLGLGENKYLKEIDSEFWKFTVSNLFGNVFSRPGLSLRDRELITLSVLVALDRMHGILTHFRAAPSVGISDDEIRELIIHVMHYAGWSVGAHAMATFRKFVDDGRGKDLFE